MKIDPVLTVILLEYIFYLLYLWEYGILYDLNPLKCSERLTWEPMMNIYAPLAKMLQYTQALFISFENLRAFSWPALAETIIMA